MNLAVIPARSGSKGLKDKNIRQLNGKPLLAYTVEAAIKSKVFDEIMVSTDSEEYKAVAMKSGANVPFLRGKELSSDTATSWSVVRNVINGYKDMGISFDVVALLQPTSPLRTAADIVEGYNELKKKDADAIVSVCEVDHPPLWSNVLAEDKSLVNFLSQEAMNCPRQTLPTYYRLNGAIYFVKTEYLVKTDNIYEGKCYASIMNKQNSIDIDDILDFKIAEVIMRDMNKK